MHHVLPLALPGILTGTIIGMARALGETAPLLMIGMVAFIVDVPGGADRRRRPRCRCRSIIWADSPERAFVERTSAAILVLLGFLLVMNAIAIFLRQRFERTLVARKDDVAHVKPWRYRPSVTPPAPMAAASAATKMSARRRQRLSTATKQALFDVDLDIPRTR